MVRHQAAVNRKSWKTGSDRTKF